MRIYRERGGQNITDSDANDFQHNYGTKLETTLHMESGTPYYAQVI
jgi:hypothetical protein